MARVLGAGCSASSDQAQWSECWELGAQQAVIKLSGQSAGSCSVVRVLGAAQWSECWELLSGQSAGAAQWSECWSCSVVRVLGAVQWSECWELGAQPVILC